MRAALETRIGECGIMGEGMEELVGVKPVLWMGRIFYLIRWAFGTPRPTFHGQQRYHRFFFRSSTLLV